MCKFVIMGIQGCGKGTQAKLLAEEFKLCHISVGDALRGHIQNQTYLGQKVQELVAAGQLVPDEIANQVVKTRLAETDCEQGFILDGYPRNASQVDYLLEEVPIDAVINIVVPDRMVMDRMLARRLCAECGEDYNMIHRPPRIEGTCDTCGGEVTSREDDTPEAITARVAAFHSETEPVLVLYRKHNLLVSVDGTGAIGEVALAIRRKLELEVG